MGILTLSDRLWSDRPALIPQGGENWFCGKKSAGRRCERGKDPPLWILSCNRKGHGTDKALVAGLLGMSPDDGRIADSLRIAEEKESRN